MGIIFIGLWMKTPCRPLYLFSAIPNPTPTPPLDLCPHPCNLYVEVGRSGGNIWICFLENNRLIVLATAGVARVPKYSPQCLKFVYLDILLLDLPWNPVIPGILLITFHGPLSSWTDCRGVYARLQPSSWSILGFLNLSTVQIWGQIILCCGVLSWLASTHWCS